MKKLTKFIILLAGISNVGCGNTSGNEPTANEPATIRWDFDINTDGWYYFHQDTASISQCTLADGCLVIKTRANTYDRQKMHTTATNFNKGTYSWRTFISPIALGDQTSIGSWIYHDDHHELDFEVGPGTSEARKNAGAADDELLACMTSQDFPYYSSYTKIKSGWHDFNIILDVDSIGHYVATWKIDGEVKQVLNLQYGTEISFQLSCSVENLEFIGDHIPQNDNYGLFDYVTFSGTLK